MILGLDIGSSSVKGALLRNGEIVGRIGRAAFKSTYVNERAEVDPADVLLAIQSVIEQLGRKVRQAEAIVPGVMAPSWLAMDARGKPLTKIITHQDRRSIDTAREIEARVGAKRHLQLAGNRPFPGGISSTTAAWFARQRKPIMKRASLTGHLNTWLLLRWTGARLTDPSNASFMGLYKTLTLGGWSDQLCEAADIAQQLLPDVVDADRIGGKLTTAGARELDLPDGMPMLVGCMDTSAVMLKAGAREGQLVNNSGSTDVLAVCTRNPKPHARLLTRALGLGRLWVSVSTLAAVGTTFSWAQHQLFPDLKPRAFYDLIDDLAKSTTDTGVRFDPYLAGDRMSIDQRQGAFTGLTLSTTREQMLHAMVDAIARSSADRLSLLNKQVKRIRRDALLSGGVSEGLGKVLHRDWPGKWSFRACDEATLRGLALMQPRER